MVNLKIDVKSDKAIKALNKLIRKVPELAVRPMSVAVQYIAGAAQEKYLRGPRPIHLAVNTGALRKSISTKVILKDKTIEAHVGTNQVSKTGFNYPWYWEFKGHNDKPRPFLRPARDNYKDKWVKIFVDEFKKELKKWIEANREV